MASSQNKYKQNVLGLYSSPYSPIWARQPHARFKIVPELDHRDGWEEKWPEILQRLSSPAR